MIVTTSKGKKFYISPLLASILLVLTIDGIQWVVKAAVTWLFGLFM